METSNVRSNQTMDLTFKGQFNSTESEFIEPQLRSANPYFSACLHVTVMTQKGSLLQITFELKLL